MEKDNASEFGKTFVGLGIFAFLFSHVVTYIRYHMGKKMSEQDKTNLKRMSFLVGSVK